MDWRTLRRGRGDDFIKESGNEFARRFYSSGAWANCRAAYAKSVGGLCEKCVKSGVYRAGEEVHHKTKLTPENIDDPTVTLCWDNLELLCNECHKMAHRKKKRYRVDEAGRLTLYDTPL